jgi:hypothetical protein
VAEVAADQAPPQLLVMLALLVHQAADQAAELLLPVVAELPGKATTVAQVLEVPTAEAVVVVVPVLLGVMVY